jgi:hypothetical protein
MIVIVIQPHFPGYWSFPHDPHTPRPTTLMVVGEVQIGEFPLQPCGVWGKSHVPYQSEKESQDNFSILTYSTC